jgi:hypothetical protein
MKLQQHCPGLYNLCFIEYILVFFAQNASIIDIERYFTHLWLRSIRMANLCLFKVHEGSVRYFMLKLIVESCYLLY